MIRVATALLAALATTATLWLVPAQAATPEATGQNKAFGATNKQRSNHDRAKLRRGDCVQRFAVRQARRMARHERMFHQDLGPVMRQCGLNTVGENVAEGYTSGRSVVRAWMHSPGHRANILNRDFRLLGIGARKGDDGRRYAAQVFGRKAG